MSPAGEFAPERLARIAAMEEWHFWFAARRDLVLALLRDVAPPPARVLDLGCGTASLSDDLARRGYFVVAMDLHLEGLSAPRASGAGSRLVRGDLLRPPFASGCADALLLLDVIEHTPDARAALIGARGLLRAGGFIVATVPALPALWSARDREAGHFRRYTRSGLRRLAESAELRVRFLRYQSFILLPLLAATRWLGRVHSGAQRLEERVPRLLNAPLRILARADAAAARRWAWPVGSSLAAVLERPA